MKDMKLSNIQKESEKMRIKKSINDYEYLKAKSLLKLGMKTFDKIRKGEIIDGDFDSLCDEIKNIDIEIYTKYMQLRNFENERKRITCECGYVAFKNEKFCPECGKSLVEEEKTYIICSSCNKETEEDSNFCSCCGMPIKQQFVNYEDEVYCDNEAINIEESIFEEVPEIDMTVEDFSQESLKEEIALEDDFDKYGEVNNEDIINEDIIVMQGREFLKNHQENNQQ